MHLDGRQSQLPATNWDSNLAHKFKPSPSASGARDRSHGDEHEWAKSRITTCGDKLHYHYAFCGGAFSKAFAGTCGRKVRVMIVSSRISSARED